MAEDYREEDFNSRKGSDEIFSKSVRAGKRTYFFDVKSTKGNDLYLTLTESKKKYNADGEFYFEKHKLFLYKEDFQKFLLGLGDAIEKIEELRTDKNSEFYKDPSESEYSSEPGMTDVSFDDI